jgi:predicted ATPase
VGHVWTRARELCEQVGDTAQLSEVLLGLWVFHGVRGELHTTQEIGEQLLRLARREHDDFLLFSAHFIMGWALFFRGELVPARANFERAMALYDPQQHSDRALVGVHDSVVLCLSYLAWSLIVLGYPDQAVTRIFEALVRTQALAHPFSLVFVRMHDVWVHMLRREAQTAQEHAEAQIALCEEQGFTFWWGWGMFCRGWALVARGHGEEGVAQMRQGIARFAQDSLMGPYARALLAEACAHIGQTAEGWTVLEKALAEVDQSEGRYYHAELHRCKGELLLQQAAPDDQQAEDCFHQALDLSRRSQAKWWELRAAMHLSRLWQHQGKRAEAHDLLAPIYGWFTEGFDTADLQEAKALLEALA